MGFAYVKPNHITSENPLYYLGYIGLGQYMHLIDQIEINHMHIKTRKNIIISCIYAISG